MNGSLLYQAYGVQGYSYASTEYKGNAIFLHLKTIVPQRCVCPHCGSLHVIKYGIVRRILHNLPFGSKPCNLSLQIQRFCCKECGVVLLAQASSNNSAIICPNKEHEFLPEILRFFMHHTLLGDNLLILSGVAAVYAK